MNLKQNGPESWMTWSEFCKGVRDTGKPQWISVKRSLPIIKNKGVLITDGETIVTASLDKNGSWGFHGFSGYECEFDFLPDEVTHWMPLPDLPSKE